MNFYGRADLKFFACTHLYIYTNTFDLCPLLALYYLHMAKTGMQRNSAAAGGGGSSSSKAQAKKPPPSSSSQQPIYKPVGEARQLWKNGRDEMLRRGRRPSRPHDINHHQQQQDDHHHQHQQHQQHQRSSILHPRTVLRLWDDRDVPQHIRDELLPAFASILQDSLDNCSDAFDNFVSYNIYWHPTCSDSIRKRYAKYYCNQHARHALIPPLSLVKIIYYLRGQTQVMQLLADRGPDFGLTLLMLLDIVYQIAFCMRRSGPGSGSSRDSKRNMAMVVVHCPRILEILSLHLDCSPLAPHFLDKFLLTCEGFLFHRKVPHAALPRFYQLQYFLSPESRPFLFKQCFEWPANHHDVAATTTATAKDRASSSTGGEANQSNHTVPDKEYLPSSLLKSVETKLWNLARSLSLGRPSPEVKRALSSTSISRQIVVSSYLDAMAVVFERLNHVARAIFGTPICSYGSAATGFATQSSDVDVVLQLGASGVSAMLTQARKLRDNDIGLDLNPFPSRTQGGFTQAVGDWSWLSEKDPTVAAAIWAGRLFAWAVHRLYGWHVQCVQSAYVPIVRILGCVGSDGHPHAVPDKLRPYSSVESSLTTAIQSIIKQNLETIMLGVDDPKSLFTLKTVSPSQRQMLCKLCAVSVVAECQYASWSPALAEGMDTLKCAAYLGGRLEDEERSNLEKQLFEVAISSIGTNASDSSSSLLLGLDSPHVSEGLSDGRLNLKALPPPSGEEIWLVEADFSADRQVGIHNSRLLRAYASCSPFVVALGLLVKYWAKNRGIGDAYAGYLSGYQWTLLVIHYLQHFFCVTPPPDIMELPEYQQLQRHMRKAGLPAFNYLPLLPNLQFPVKEDPTKGLCIVEMEGPVEVSFFQPGMGCNRNLPRSVLESCKGEDAPPLQPSEPSSPRQREWPEDRLLLADPLMYAYEQLTPPFDLEPVVASGMSEQGLHELWLLRVRTAPRVINTETRKRGKNELDTNYELWDARRQQNKKQLLQDPPAPDASARKRGSDVGVTKLLPFPSLSSIRSRAFISDHIMIKGQLSLPFGPDLTLTELLYGFFEYYGLRFNYATDIADIDRVPELPRGKKEFFETGLFTPKVFDINPFPRDEDFRINYPIVVSENESREERPRPTRTKRTDDIESAPEDTGEASRRKTLRAEPSINPTSHDHDHLEPPRDTSPSLPANHEGEVAGSDAEEDGIAHEEDDSAHVTHAKEVVGRGNGPYQYRGRHFLCILDPFEKLRTIGPPCRCQSHISTELIIALQLFGMMRAELRKNGDNIPRLQAAVDQLFATNATGIHPVGRVRHPIIESLGQILTRLQELHPPPSSSSVSDRHSIYHEWMYPGLVSTVLENGKYKIAFTTYKERIAEAHNSKPPPPTLPREMPRKPAPKSPEMDPVSQEPTRATAHPPPPPTPQRPKTEEHKSTPAQPTSIYRRSDGGDDDEVVNINCVPPGFEEHSPQERKPPFIIKRDPQPPPSPSAPIVGVVDEESKKIVGEYFSQCPHFVLNYGDYSSSSAESPNLSQQQQTPWRYSEAAVEMLKSYPLCECAQQQQSARARQRTSSRQAKSTPNASPQINPQPAQVEPHTARWTPRDNEMMTIHPPPVNPVRQLHWTSPSPSMPCQMSNPSDLTVHLATAQSVNQNIAALVSRSLNVSEGAGPEEARQILLSLIWGGNTAPGPQSGGGERESRRQRHRHANPRPRNPRNPGGGVPRSHMSTGGRGRGRGGGGGRGANGQGL